MVEKELYDDAHFLLTTKYLIDNRYGETEKDFSTLCDSINSIDEYRKQRLGLRTYSLVAKEIIARASIAGKNYDKDLIDTDLLVYYISKYQKEWWFPRTYIYMEFGVQHIHKFLRKLKSKRFAERAKTLFGVNNMDEIRNWIDDVANMGTSNGYSDSFDKVPGITCFIKPEEVGSYS